MPVFDRQNRRIVGIVQIIRIDKRRAGYYNYYTGRKWGRIENYDLVINVDKTGIDGAVAVILEYLSRAV